MKQPIVSVIIPTFNRRDFVKEAIESVLRQDLPAHEVIVIDDGSTDDTEVIIRYYDNVAYYCQENRGISRARNHGLSRARGEYIAFLDSDDLWMPNKLSEQLREMEKNPDLKVSYTDEVWIRNGVRVNPRKKHQKYSGWIFERCLPLCIISPSSVMLKREVFGTVGTFDENLPVCEDYDLWLRVSARFPILFIDQKLIVKRGGHEDQLSHRFWGNDRFRVQALVKSIQEGGLPERQKQAAIRELIRKSAILENGFRKRGNSGEADRYRCLIERYAFDLPS
ncbi:MAG: glycosyltransferase [Deltaproteobacteria bacterium]|nr:glycosyltransferase [Deltaproteobacteria bacterium]